MDYGTRYHVARIIAWVMMAATFLGLLYTGASTNSARVLGVLLFTACVVMGIISAVIAIYSKAKQTHHEDHLGTQALQAYGHDLRRQYASRDVASADE